LERLQLEAAGIITGLPIFTNTEYLNRETGWERLTFLKIAEIKTLQTLILLQYL
jgi:hypothetical protein